MLSVRIRRFVSTDPLHVPCSTLHGPLQSPAAFQALKLLRTPAGKPASPVEVRRQPVQGSGIVLVLAAGWVMYSGQVACSSRVQRKGRPDAPPALASMAGSAGRLLCRLVPAAHTLYRAFIE